MTITLDGLLSADTAALRAVAAHWAKLVADIDATVEDLVHGTRDLPHHWTGDAAQAAAARGTELQVRIGNAHRFCDTIATTVRGFADDIDQLRRTLHDTVAEAEANGLTVDLGTGRISAPIEQSPSIEAYVARIGEIVAQADAADQKARLILDDNVIREQDLPTAELPGYATDVLTVAGIPPQQKAAFWHELHPLNRDRLINEHPELIGPTVGLPSTARDQANRILLGRAKAGLLTRRDRLDAVQDGAASRATLDVEDRLAEVTAVEKRLAADPKARLLGYPPAVLAGGDPRWDNYQPPAR